ncbi:MAG: PorT family protein [Bacteroidales bacterium]|nr:PorT family protein [Bacteroidales bacterium]
MKKQIIGVALLMAILTIFSVQKANAQFSFGAKVAGNAVSLDNFQDFDGGFDLGLFFRAGKSLFFQPEVCYSFRSTDFRNIVGEFHENYSMRQHFLDVPLLLGYHFINNNNFKMHLLVGPRVAILVNNHLREVASIQDVASHLQWGGRFGIGFDFWRFTLDGYYDIAADKTSTNDSKSRVQNMFVVSLGFKFIK